MKKIFFLLFLIHWISCKDDDIPNVTINDAQLTIENYFIDEENKLIVLNSDINQISLSENLETIFLNKKYTFPNPIGLLEIGQSYTVTADNETYQLYFTELPIISIQIDTPIPDEPKAFAKAKFVSFDAAEIYDFNIGIEIRGGWSTQFPKKSYGFEIWEDEIGEVSKDMSFLNMRDDDDWILDAMYNDPLRMRNLVSHRLWNDIHQPYYQSLEPEAKATIRSEYIEIFINKKYQGIYALSERADRKLLKLKKYNGDIRGEMYKGIAWGNSNFTNLTNYDNSFRTWEGFQMVYPLEEEITDWGNVYDLVDFVVNSSDQDFINEISNKIYIENFIDYFIFFNILRATDNTGKNINLCKYDSNQPYFYMPWDLDGTWGTQYEGLRDPTTNDILSHGLYQRLFNLNPNEFQNSVNNRWNELKNNNFEYQQLLSKFQKEKELLQRNGVYERESLVWDFEFQEDDYIYMSNWMNERWNYLNDFFQ